MNDSVRKRLRQVKARMNFKERGLLKSLEDRLDPRVVLDVAPVERVGERMAEINVALYALGLELDHHCDVVVAVEGLDVKS